ncbi:MAG TPA: hypothetical protein VMV37_11965 [Gammaproteobacteria bacterium]|nr:hypothetical protein [Gammaproteobacteria bacterium]
MAVVLWVASALLLGACGRPAVDPALVGVWERAVPGGTWRLAIDAAGRYQFTVDGGNAAPTHNGAFTAHDGEWTMHATNIALDDHGRYELGPGGAIKLTGNRGVLSWQRGAAPPAATTPATAAAVATSPGAAPAASFASTPAAKAGTPAATSVAASSAAPKPVAASPPPQAAAANPSQAVAAPRSSGAALPDTIDPCLLVTAAEAARMIGTTLEPQRTTPQPHQQNDCRYHQKGSELSVAITTYNGGGLDVPGYLANHARDSTALEGVGDAAYFHYQAPTKLASVNWVIGAASFEILVAGVPRERAEPFLRELAPTAAKRAVGSSAFQVPGLERFVGTWMSRQLGKDNSDVVVWIDRDGSVRLQGLDGFAGTMTLMGSKWSVVDPSIAITPNGEFSLAGDRLTLRGDYLQAEMTRVPCNKGASKVRPPYDLTKMIAGRLNGKGLAAFNPQADGKQFDPRLAGLWEGEGKTTNNRSTQALVSLDDKGRGVFALFPTATGKFTASNGNYELAAAGANHMAGTYAFEGGVSDGLVKLVNGNETYELSPYDANRHPPYETPIVGHCP